MNSCRQSQQRCRSHQQRARRRWGGSTLLLYAYSSRERARQISRGPPPRSTGFHAAADRSGRGSLTTGHSRPIVRRFLAFCDRFLTKLYRYCPATTGPYKRASLKRLASALTLLPMIDGMGVVLGAASYTAIVMISVIGGTIVGIAIYFAMRWQQHRNRHVSNMVPHDTSMGHHHHQ